MMKRTVLFICMLTLVAAGSRVHTSDRTAVYAKVDRVVLEPNGDTPDTIQVFGVFSVAVPNNPNDYRPADRGYLYFRPGKDPAAARREWADLKAVAGTGQLVAFGSRFQSVPRLRHPDEKPANPDAYITDIGLQKVHARGNYAPIRSLLDYRP